MHGYTFKKIQKQNVHPPLLEANLKNGIYIRKIQYKQAAKK